MKPIFVTGFVHSGTTLLGNMLNEHSQCFGPFETNLMYMDDLTPEDWYLWNETATATYLRRLYRLNQEELPGISLPASDWEGLYSYLASVLLSSAVSRKTKDESKLVYYIDKHPEHWRRLKQIHTRFPEAPIIVILRDPFAIWSSWHSRAKRRAQIHHYVRRFNKAIKAYDEHSKAHISTTFFVYYEDLLRWPLMTMRDIANFCGLLWEQSMATPNLVQDLTGKLSRRSHVPRKLDMNGFDTHTLNAGQSLVLKDRDVIQNMVSRSGLIRRYVEKSDPQAIRLATAGEHSDGNRDANGR